MAAKNNLADIRREINKILDDDGGVSLAYEALLAVTKDEAQRAWLRSKTKYQLDIKCKMVHEMRKETQEDMVKAWKDRIQAFIMGDKEDFIAIRQKVNQLLDDDGGISLAKDALMAITKDEAERAWLLSEYKFQMDMQSKLVHARRKGFEEGYKEGLEIARKKLMEEAIKN
ncbi:MAG: hypothetical protein LBU82_01625 [Treponema sp.]|jgi:predicted PP-loop superfamily ATPase|nr:hypothetical protein [Treponema sp.]